MTIYDPNGNLAEVKEISKEKIGFYGYAEIGYGILDYSPTIPVPATLFNIARDLGVEELAKFVLEDSYFWQCSASSLINNDPKSPRLHHYGEGGLAKHTTEVVELCLHNAERYSNVNKQILFLAALYHDVGKMRDYEFKDGEWYGAEHKRRIHHVSRSALFWNEVCAKNPNPYSEDVLHCVLSHHGRREWGSPVAPDTKEAWLLHLCDAMSARMDDCGRVDMLKTEKTS